MDKGTAFELEVKQLLKDELFRGDLGIDPALAQIFHRKSYFSRDRERIITMDISLELCRKNSSEPYLVWIWECKNYGKLVPVDDIEEFHSKLEQVGVHKTKGTVACRKGFQKGAINYAKAKGIGLVRILSDGACIRLVEAVKTITLERASRALTELDTLKLDSMFYAISTTGCGVDGLRDLVVEELRYKLGPVSTKRS